MMDKPWNLREFSRLWDALDMISCILAEQPANARWSLQIAFPPKNKICPKTPRLDHLRTENESTQPGGRSSVGHLAIFLPETFVELPARLLLQFAKARSNRGRFAATAQLRCK